MMKKHSEAELAKHVLAASQNKPASSTLILRSAPSTADNKSFDEMLAEQESLQEKPAPTALQSVLKKTGGRDGIDWTTVENEVHEIDVGMVVDSPFQTEDENVDRYESSGIDELAHTMANSGQQEPILVRWVKDRFELIAGHRRIRAARSMNWATIRALVVKKADRDAKRSLMVHNEGRKGNSDYTRAKLYERAKAEGFARSQKDLAHMFATDQGAVSRRLAMLTLPSPVRQLLDVQPNLINSWTAKAIHDLLAETPDQIDLVVKAIERVKLDGAPESGIRGWVAQMAQAQSKAQSKPSAKSKPKVITDPRNRQLYTAKLDGRVITLRCSAPDLNPQEELDLLVEFFQTRASAKAKETEH